MSSNTTAVATVDKGLQQILESAMPELKKVAPKYINVTRMVSLAIEAKMRNRLLAKCSPVSVLNFCKKCAETGTDRIGPGGMWAVPFKNGDGGYDMTPIPDWRLLIEKAKRSKAITHATAEAVYENDTFSYERGMNPNLAHRPALKNRGRLVFVYCVYSLPDGTKDFVVMDWEEDIVPIRDRTNAWKAYMRDKSLTNPWVTDPAEQAKKTVVKRAMKLFEGASIELTALLETDNVINGYADASVAPEPIAMPVAIEPERVAGQSASDNSEPDGGDTQAVGPIEDVTIRSGEKNGRQWTKYGVKVGGVIYGTFDTAIGDWAEEHKGQVVRLSWEQKGEHRNIVDLSLADVEAA